MVSYRATPPPETNDLSLPYNEKHAIILIAINHTRTMTTTTSASASTTPTTTTTLTTTMKPACPHSTIAATAAVAAAVDDHSASSDDLIHSCPAFEKGVCPFSTCSDEDEIRKMLLEIPASHFENRRGEQFKTILQSLHTTATNHKAEGVLGMAACPVANLLPQLGQQEEHHHVSFTEAVEDFSLAAIMSKMAKEYQKKNFDAASETIEMARKLLLSTGDAPKPTGAAVVTDRSIIAAAIPIPTPPLAGGGGGHRRASLSASFKNGTAAAHQAAENVHFVANFIRGQIDRRLYADLVSQLAHVYAALEERLDECGGTDPVLAQFRPFHEKLRRTKALEEDVDFWGRRDIFPESIQYADRLRSLDPLLLLAHSYTRYLGDLSGGKILQRAARRAMDLKTDGLAFYEFDQIASAKLFKDEFRAAMDSLRLPPSDVDRLVHEANIAFLLNMRIFEVLDVKANFPGATVRSLEEVLAFEPSTTGSKECPFAKPSAAGGGVTNATKKGRCPWPFIILHDPVVALRDWQTWALFGVLFSIAWRFFISSS